MSSAQLTKHSTHLWISDPTTTEQLLVKSLQQLFCAKNCGSCTICTTIRNKTHPWIVWLEPENSYTVEQIDQVIESVQFLLDSQEKRFFIFTQAHELSVTCCNRLLKTIEEPHIGYHFVFLTHRPQALLPTLRSRCFAQNFQFQTEQHPYQVIMQPFVDQTCSTPLQFMKLIDKQGIKESCTKEVIDLLIEHFYQKVKQAVQEKNIHAQNKNLDLMIILKKSLFELPIQGSHKLFWKNLYIAFHKQLQIRN